MRLHILGCARNASTPFLTMDPYAMISYYLTTYLHRAGHEVHYYGYKESTVECTKKWECGDHKFLSEHYVTEFATNHWKDPAAANEIFFNKAKDHLLTNYKTGDIIITNWSPSVDILRSSFPAAKIVDGNINHRDPSSATNYHVHSSITNQHFLYGAAAQRAGKYDTEDHWHDTVIYPIANELNNFRFNEDKQDYFFFMARLGVNKGLTILRDIAEHFPNKKFIIAGQGHMIIDLLPNMEFVGCLNGEEKKEYLANAKAVISPSYYTEPFGLTPIEAGLSGTPTICTDWGGYTENVLEGVTGFRCTYFNDFVNAINNIDTIKPKDCRKFTERFAAETLIKDWEKYLNKINRNEWYDLD
jgi:glycosyltransferase involved in cell wall biosynthesis